MTTESAVLRVAIIGSGPAGIYAADALLHQTQQAVAVDVFDRLPTPYGLVRYGVAPDHGTIKAVTRIFARTLADTRVRFFGNVAIGRDLSRAELHEYYGAIIYAFGASHDRRLGIPGEDITGNFSATEFVAWYNGHPDSAMDHIGLRARGVAVVGAGNVAIDVTRILAKTPDELRTTDIADHALADLGRSAVTDVYLLARRGPVQAKFTTKELRELGELSHADIVVRAEELVLDAASEAALAGQNVAQKNLEVLRGFAAKPLEGKPRRVHLRFLVSPVEVRGEESVTGVVIERNRLDARQNAVGTGERETLPVEMVLRSVGYRGAPLPGVPFDARTGTVPNNAGRVVEDDHVVPGEYVTGWIKRGPSGLIGTNKADSAETVRSLIEDIATLPRHAATDADAIAELLHARGVRVITLEDWFALDRHEIAQGEAQGRPRVKITQVEEMLRHLASVPPTAP